jgi:uncharacterized protein (DUF952 family)
MLIYKICTQKLWEESVRNGLFSGMPIDIRDGYIHFSTAEQNEETARKYFSGQTGLVLLAVDSDSLGDDLRWEPSSSGSRPGLFPHLYAPLKIETILSAEPFAANTPHSNSQPIFG